jgi:hypothetical protein
MSKIKNMKMRYKVGVGVATTAAVVGLGGAAFAYFTSTGSGTSSGTVAGAQTNTWGVTFGTATYSVGSAIYPNTTENIPVTIKNTGNGNQGLTSVTVALKTSGSDVADSTGADISGCLSSWWTATVTDNANAANVSNWSVANPDDLAVNGTDPESVTLKLNDAAVSQNSCETALPGFTVTAG